MIQIRRMNEKPAPLPPEPRELLFVMYINLSDGSKAALPG